MSNFLKQVTELNIYLQPIQLLLGVGLNTITIFVLSSPVLRKSSCTYYFIASAVFSILYTVQICPTQFLRAYNLNWTANPIGCKINNFSFYLPVILVQTMLLLASFDRYCLSSNATRLRSKLTTQNAKKTILVVSILITLSMIPTLIIYYWNETTKICQIYSDLIVSIYGYNQIIFTSVLIPLITIIFGSLTIYHIRRSTVRVAVIGTVQRYHRTEGQLVRMLIFQIIITTLAKIPFLIVFGINTFHPSSQTAYMWAIRSITVLIAQSEYYITFFLYIISAKVYREECIKQVTFIESRFT